jgi:hypothetical protein
MLGAAQMAQAQERTMRYPVKAWSRAMGTVSRRIRVPRVVRDMADKFFLWIVDASDHASIECRVVDINSCAYSGCAVNLFADAVSFEGPIDELIARAGLTQHIVNAATFADAETVVKFLAGENDRALQWNARKLLDELMATSAETAQQIPAGHSEVRRVRHDGAQIPMWH